MGISPVLGLSPATRKIAALLLVLGWLVALALPVVRTGPSPQDVFPGWLVLAMGWMGPFILQFGWFANLLLVPAIIFLLSARPPVRASYVIAGALLLAVVNTLFWRDVMFDNGAKPITAYGSGYVLWIAVMIAAAALLAHHARASAHGAA